MAGTETGMKWLERKFRSLRKPDSEEGKITQTDAYRPPVPLEKMLGDSADSAEARKASLDKRMNMFSESLESKAAGGSVGGKGMKKGGKVSSASKRADGIAQRGKTRGKLV